jgi:hypothetical protein
MSLTQGRLRSACESSTIRQFSGAALLELDDLEGLQLHVQLLLYA